MTIKGKETKIRCKTTEISCAVSPNSCRRAALQTQTSRRDQTARGQKQSALMQREKCKTADKRLHKAAATALVPTHQASHHQTEPDTEVKGHQHPTSRLQWSCRNFLFYLSREARLRKQQLQFQASTSASASLPDRGNFELYFERIQMTGSKAGHATIVPASSF